MPSDKTLKIEVAYTEQPSIAYECDAYLVLSKPRGMHTDGESETLASWLGTERPAQFSISNDAGLIQRLDFFTCGLVVAAKNIDSYEKLKLLLREKQISKSYLALVEGAWEESKTVTTYIGSPYRHAKKVRVYPEKPAKKHRALLGTTTFTPVASKPNLSLVRASAPLARRHQVRAHASFLGHPLLGDDLYGATSSLASIMPHLKEGFFLFASQLSMPEVLGEEAVSVGVTVPEWLNQL